MTPAQLERLGEHLQRLRLFKSRERLEALLQEAATQELPYVDFLERVLSEEVASKTAKHISMRTSLARFPFGKSLESFEVRLPALAGQETDPAAGLLPLHRARREHRHPGSARADAPPDGARRSQAAPAPGSAGDRARAGS